MKEFGRCSDVHFLLLQSSGVFATCIYCIIFSEIVDQPGVDIFGQVYNQWKNKECECPNCKRLIAASRFAPHLEKCLGMGRNSSRIANRRSVSQSRPLGNTCTVPKWVSISQQSGSSSSPLTGWPVIITWANLRVIRKTMMTSMITTGRMGPKRKVGSLKLCRGNDELLPHNKHTSYFPVAAKKRKSDKVCFICVCFGRTEVDLILVLNV